MLTLILAWCLLLVIAIPIGYLLVEAVTSRDVVDRPILAAWGGVLVIQAILLLAALEVPLTPLSALSVAAPLAILAVLSRQVRTAVRRDIAAYGRRGALAAIPVVVGVSVLAAKPISWQDSGLYHLGAINWLSFEGVVPGLALLHARFGFVSSWFALHAPFNHGPLFSRVGTVGGGLVVLLVMAHLLSTSSRLIEGRGSVADGFAVLAWLALLPLVLWMGSSPAPDLPVIALTVVAAFAMSSSAVRSQEERPAPAGLFPLIIGAGATAIKLSALPLLAVGFLFALRTRRMDRSTVLAGLVAAALLIPLILAQLRITGCPAFPAALLCVDAPSSIGAEAAREMTTEIRNFARWDGRAPDGAGNLEWVVGWVGRHWVTVGVLLLSVLSVIWNYRNRTAAPGAGWIAALGLGGSAYVLYTAPAPRFLFGYAVLPLAFALAPTLLRAQKAAPSWSGYAVLRRYWTRVAATAAGFAIAGAALFANATAESLSGKVHPSQAIVPPAARPDVPLVQRRAGALLYFNPADGGICWAVREPCTPYLVATPLTVRSPSEGIGSGIQRDQTGDGLPIGP